MKPASAGFISKSDFFTFRENATAEAISSSKQYAASGYARPVAWLMIMAEREPARSRNLLKLFVSFLAVFRFSRIFLYKVMATGNEYGAQQAV